MGGNTKDRLVRLRISRGLTMRSAAEAIDISLDTLRRVEAGASPAPGRPGGVREDVAYKIATFYGLEVEDLWPFKGNGDDKTKKAA